jgi:hypothetical protein
VAIACPMPAAPPVTRTTFPLMSKALSKLKLLIVYFSADKRKREGAGWPLPTSTQADAADQLF